MATNTFNNIADITPVAMDVLENNLVFSKHVNRGYDDRFRETGGKIGDTANIRIPGYYTVRSGKVASPQGYNDTFASVTLAQKGVDIQFSSKELRLNVDEFKHNVLEPALVPLANQIDLDLCNLLTGVNQATFSSTTPATKLTDLEQFLQAQALLDEMAIPRNNRATVINPRTNANVVKGLSGLFNPQTAISEQFNSGNIGHALGMDWSMDQNLLPFTTGAFGTSTPAVATTATEAAATIALKALANPHTIKVGDVLTFANVYAVNPVTKTSTGQLKQFVVTAAVAATAATTETITVSPAFISTGPTQNISALPQADALVYFYGTSQTSGNAGLVCPTSAVFHRDAFLLACADLPKVGPSELCSRIKSKVSDISFRMIKYYDGRNDDELYRLDVLYGVALLRPNHAVRVLG